MIKIEIECPYCNRVHVHNIDVKPELQARVEIDIDEHELPHDEETDDLENFREGD